jgi:intracellular septation protein A
MKLWTYRRPFMVEGRSFRVVTIVTLKKLTSRLYEGEQMLAQDSTDYWTPEGMSRSHMLQVDLGECGTLSVEVGYVNLWSIGITAYLNDRMIHESHPGKTPKAPIQISASSSKDLADISEASVARAAEARAAAEKWQRNKYSIYTDISLGILFFVVAKATDHLATAAVVTAIAGLGVVIAQRFVKVDLLGGLAMFGVFMLLISAGFSLVFDDDSIVKMKSTYLGLLVATLMLSDAAFNRGGYFGRRLARYMPSPVDTRRLAFGMAMLGAVMAGLNYFVAHYFSTDIWLYYTSAGDFIVSVILMFSVIRFAQLREDESEKSDT